jgi:ribonucleoside-triphosphate reductase
VHTLNKKLRPSHQSPFTNISIFDRPNLEILFGEMRFPDGSLPDFDVVQELQKIFCDWFYKAIHHFLELLRILLKKPFIAILL